MPKKKDKTMWWILALGGVAAAWYLLKNKAAAAPLPTTALPPAASTTTLLPHTNALPGGSAPIIPSTGINTAIVPQLQFNTPTFSQPSVPAVAVTTISPIPAAPTAPTVDEMNTLQSWAMSNLNPCDLSRWHQYKSSFTPQEWAALVDIYFNDWVGGQGNTPERIQEWDDWRAKYQILTNTPC